MASILNDLRKKTGWCCDWTAPSVLIVSRGPQSTTPQRGQRRQLASASLFADAGRRYFQKKKHSPRAVEARPFLFFFSIFSQRFSGWFRFESDRLLFFSLLFRYFFLLASLRHGPTASVKSWMGHRNGHGHVFLLFFFFFKIRLSSLFFCKKIGPNDGISLVWCLPRVSCWSDLAIGLQIASTDEI